MLSDKDLDDLDAQLLSIPEEAGGMLLPELDGFFAGLVVSPEMIPPGEWLPNVWGANGTEVFETLEEVQRLTDLVMRHYNDVAQSLTPPGEYAPLYDEDKTTGEIIWELWVTGFEQAMRLRPDSWEQIVQSSDEEAGACVNMMLALHAIAEGQSDLPRKTIRELTEQAPDLIPNLVVTINGWTKGRTAPAPF